MLRISQVGAERTVYDDNMQRVDAAISKCNAAMKAIRAAMAPCPLKTKNPEIYEPPQNMSSNNNLMLHL